MARWPIDGVHRLFDGDDGFLEPTGDILHTAVSQAFHHALVGGEGIQGAQLLIITPCFNVVEGLGVKCFGQFISS